MIGVPANPNSVSDKVLINLVSGDFRGVVYPVNADHESVEYAIVIKEAWQKKELGCDEGIIYR